MTKITQIHIAWELRKANKSTKYIATQIGVHRATVYRWLKGIRQNGIRGYIQIYKNAKKGRRVHQTSAVVKKRVIALRREYRNCCGQKIQYLLKQEGIHISLSTIYRILGRHFKLRKHQRTARGKPLRTAKAPREAIQMDTVDFGELFAYTAVDVFTKEAQVVFRPTLRAEDGKQALEEIMKYFGHCSNLQTDGGKEFEAEFAEVVGQYTDQHVIGRPYRKNDQAFIECFNGTLRREEFGKPKFRSDQLTEVQQMADQFILYYHYKRPHMALDMKTPLAFAESHLR